MLGHQKHGRAVAIAARRLPAVAHILPTVVGAAQRVDLAQVVRRALGLGLDDAGEGGGEEDLHHGALRGAVSLSVKAELGEGGLANKSVVVV